MKSKTSLKSFVLVLAFAIFFTFSFAAVSTSRSYAATGGLKLASGKYLGNTVYVGQQYKLNTTSVYKGKLSVNSKKVTLEKINSKQYILTPKSPGTVSISYRINAKQSKKKTVTILKRSTSVAANVNKVYLNPGQTFNLTASLSPADSSDVVQYSSDNKAVATVGYTKGEISAVSNGIAKITVYAKETKVTRLSNTKNNTTVVMVYVGPQLESLIQMGNNALMLSFNKELLAKNLKSSDIIITDKETKAVIDVSTMTIGYDGTYTNVYTTQSFTAGRTYIVKVYDVEKEFIARYISYSGGGNSEEVDGPHLDSGDIEHRPD